MLYLVLKGGELLYLVLKGGELLYLVLKGGELLYLVLKGGELLYLVLQGGELPDVEGCDEEAEEEACGHEAPHPPMGPGPQPPHNTFT